MELFDQLKVRVESGDVAWVKENSIHIVSLKIKGANPKYGYEPSERDGWKDDDWTKISRYRRDFTEDIALIYFNSTNESVKNSALQALKHIPFFYIEDVRYSDINKQLIDMELLIEGRFGFELTGEFLANFSIVDKVELSTALAKENPSVDYNLDDSDFMRDELCRAVGADEIGYVVLLISQANFDVGLLRCEDTHDWGYGQYAAYNGDHYCPMSLRRLSGVNAGRAIASRNASFLRNLGNNNFSGMGNDLKKIKTAFQKSLNNLPDLSDVNSMNDLLDKYDKWNPGGNCTTLDLLKVGVDLPEGW